MFYIMKLKFLIIFTSFLFLLPTFSFAINIDEPDNIEYLTNEYIDNVYDIFVDQRSGQIYVPNYSGLINYYNGTNWTVYEVAEHANSINNIAVDSTGKMYVVSDCQIHIFTANGSFINSEGTEGCFTGVAVDNEDNLFAILGSYIVYYGYIEEYDAWGWWDYDGSMIFMNNPSDIYIDQNNTVYVTDDGNRAVYRHIEGNDWETLPSLPEVDEPSGVYADSKGNIFILDRDYDHLSMLSNDTNEWSFYNDEEILGQPESVASYDTDTHLYVYVTDNTFGNRRVVKLTYNLPQSEPVSTSTTTNTTAKTNSHTLSSSFSPSVYACSAFKPSSVSDLFEIKTTRNTAKLFFTPQTDTADYYISFSEKPIAEDHGEQVTLIREGVQSHTVYLLKPNTTYYFKIRGQNGCAPGEWSNVMKVKTNSKTYYKN